MLDFGVPAYVSVEGNEDLYILPKHQVKLQSFNLQIPLGKAELKPTDHGRSTETSVIQESIYTTLKNMLVVGGVPLQLIGKHPTRQCVYCT